MILTPKLVIGAGGEGIVKLGVLGVCMLKGIASIALERCLTMAPGMLRSTALSAKPWTCVKSTVTHKCVWHAVKVGGWSIHMPLDMSKVGGSLCM